MVDGGPAAGTVLRARARAAVRPALFGAINIFLSLLCAFLFIVVIVLCVHGNVGDALSAFRDGVTVGPYGPANTLLKVIPLLLTGLGVAIAFRARMWNIGGQGQFVLGALAASYFGVTCKATAHLPGEILVPIVMAGGIIAGAAWAGIAAVLKTARNVPEVISTIMLNFVSLQLLSFLASGPWRTTDGTRPPFTATFGNAASLSTMTPSSTIHDGIYIAVFAMVVVWAMLDRTGLGYSIKVVGAAPDAARLAGHSTSRTVISAMVWSGALCGLAGAVELSGTLHYLANDYKPDYGFTAVAVALLGRLTVPGVLMSAILFGALSVGSANMERDANIPHQVGYVVQAVLLLAFLIAPNIGQGWSKWRKGPAEQI